MSGNVNIKDFYQIKDFYNLIKKSGTNPYPHNLFVVQPYFKHGEFQKKFAKYISNFPLLVQSIDNVPDFDISDQAFTISTANGQFKSVSNNIVNGNGELTLKFLDT